MVETIYRLFAILYFSTLQEMCLFHALPGPCYDFPSPKLNQKQAERVIYSLFLIVTIRKNHVYEKELLAIVY